MHDIRISCRYKFLIGKVSLEENFTHYNVHSFHSWLFNPFGFSVCFKALSTFCSKWLWELVKICLDLGLSRTSTWMRCLKAMQVFFFFFHSFCLFLSLFLSFFFLILPQLLEMTENNTCEQQYIQNKSPIRDCCGWLHYGFEIWKMWAPQEWKQLTLPSPRCVVLQS